MARNTENYNLKKPDKNDFYNIDDFNNNMDIIDEALKNIDVDLSEYYKKSELTSTVSGNSGARLVNVEASNGYLAESLYDRLTKLQDATIIVSETKPTHPCVWFQVLEEKEIEEPVDPQLIEYELETIPYDETKKFHVEIDEDLETMKNATDEVLTADTNDLIFTEI